MSLFFNMVGSVLSEILNCLKISYLGLLFLVISFIMFTFSSVVNVFNLRLRDAMNNNIINNTQIQLYKLHSVDRWQLLIILLVQHYSSFKCI